MFSYFHLRLPSPSIFSCLHSTKPPCVGFWNLHVFVSWLDFENWWQALNCLFDCPARFGFCDQSYMPESQESVCASLCKQFSRPSLPFSRRNMYYDLFAPSIGAETSPRNPSHQCTPQTRWWLSVFSCYYPCLVLTLFCLLLKSFPRTAGESFKTALLPVQVQPVSRSRTEAMIELLVSHLILRSNKPEPDPV